jgi:hypothetical protein
VFYHLLFAIAIASVLVVVPSGLVLQQWMIHDINCTGRFKRVSHWRRIGWRQDREIGEVYGQLFPGGWKLDVYNVLHRLSIATGIIMAAFLAASFIMNKNSPR